MSEEPRLLYRLRRMERKIPECDCTHSTIDLSGCGLEPFTCVSKISLTAAVRVAGWHGSIDEETVHDIKDALIAHAVGGVALADVGHEEP